MCPPMSSVGVVSSATAINIIVPALSNASGLRSKYLMYPGSIPSALGQLIDTHSEFVSTDSDSAGQVRGATAAGAFLC